jgi:hypothetical protein
LANTGSDPVTDGGTHWQLMAGPTAPSGAQNLALMTPDGSSGISTLRAIVANDIPSLSYDASGAAATETARAEAAEALLAPLTSAHLITPLLGTPTSGTLINCTFPTLNQNTTGTAGGLTGDPNIAVGIVTLVGSVSGAATITAPSVAGTLTNPVVFSNAISVVNSITLQGTTSGAATITGPAIAGTITNPISLSNSVMVGGGVVLFNDTTGNQGQIAFVPAGTTYYDYLNTQIFRAISNGRATTLTLGVSAATAATVTGTLTATTGVIAGIAGTTAGVLTLEGLTSGAATITAPAVAGTAANPFMFSNGINIPSGTGLGFNSDTVLWRSSANVFAMGNSVGNLTGQLNVSGIYSPGGSLTTGTASITNLTIVTAIPSYAGNTLVKAGIPSLVASSSLTAQAAAIAATTIFAVNKAGLYRVSYCASITTADTTACVLGGATGFQVKFTNASDSVVKTSNPTTVTSSATNATTTTISGALYANCLITTNLQYLFGYTATTGNMRYDLEIYVEYLG